MAAVIVVCSVVAGFMARDGAPQSETAVASNPDHEAIAQPSVTASLAATSQPVARLVEQSRELDEILQNLPRAPEVQRVSLAATVDRIEQRVQWLDVQLSSVPDTASEDPLAHQLWRERVDLMDSLVTVRYAQALPMSF